MEQISCYFIIIPANSDLENIASDLSRPGINGTKEAVDCAGVTLTT